MIVTKTQLKEIAESKGFELVKAWEAYSNGQRKVWGIKKDSVITAIGNGKDALAALNRI